MSAKDPNPWRFWNAQHDRDVDEALARKRKQQPAPSPVDPSETNPWKSRNVTRQFELIAQDPAHARQLCEEAGCVWTEPQNYYERRK